MEQFNIFSMDVSNTVMMPITAALDDDDDIETSGEGIMARSCKYLHSECSPHHAKRGHLPHLS